MKTREDGFTLIELLITLVLVLMILNSVTTFFLSTFRQYKQQSKIVETGVETVIGLELLRRDLEHAGLGLPWSNLPASYQEAVAVGGLPTATLNDAPSGVPRGLVSADNSVFGGSDYLVIRSSASGSDPVAGKWTTLQSGDVKRTWGDGDRDLDPTDRVIVLAPAGGGVTLRSLVSVGGSYSVPYNSTSPYAAPTPPETRVVYGISSTSALRMPFNRTDYYVDASSVPFHCAPNSGVLVRRTVSHATGALSAPEPLLDCVASMQVDFQLDTNGDGVVDDPGADDISALSAEQVRTQVRGVRVSLLTHEGQLDPSYTHGTTTIPVGNGVVDVGAARNYRWKVYTLTVNPPNLGE